MIKVEFLGPIGREPMEVEASSLNELKHILNKIEDLSEWLKICAVAVNDEIVSDAGFLLKDGDRVAILPPVCGG